MGILWENSFWVFILLTVILGGGAAFLTGRAVAGTWRAFWTAALYSLLLAAFVRFLHFSLFGGSLLSLHFYLVDFIIVMVMAAIGYRLVRATQMVVQYSWLYERSGPFGWRARKP